MDVIDRTLHDGKRDRDVDVAIYGDAGRAVIALPDWDFSSTSWENGGMVGALSDMVENGRVQLFCPESTDASGWYGRSLDIGYRHGNVTAYLGFVERELLTFVRETAISDEPPLLVGVGIGALNATILALRHPERYGGLLALSGSYDARSLVGTLDEAWESLSPVDVAAALPARGKVVRTLRTLPLAFVCGQGEDAADIASQRALDSALAEKRVGATFEYWGYDVTRDWAWWCEEARQLLPCLLDEHGLAERQVARRVSVARMEAEHAAEVLEQGEAALAALRERLGAASVEVAATASRYEQEQAEVARCAERFDELASVARDAWAERERVAQLLGEAQARGDEAQAAADAAAGDLSAAEWICGEARAQADGARAAEDELLAQAEEAEAVVERAKSVAQRTARELAEVSKVPATGRGAAGKATGRPAARRGGSRRKASPSTADAASS